MPTQIKCRAVIRDGNKVLLCKLKWRFWCLPGWTLENWETRQECLRREILEELWVEPVIGAMIHINEFVRDGDTVLDFWYEVVNGHDFHNIDVTSTSHGYELDEVQFIDLDHCDEEVKPSNLHQILQSLS